MDETTVTIEKASETEIVITVQEPAPPKPEPKVQTVSLDSLVAQSNQYANDIAFIQKQKDDVDAQIAQARDLGVVESSEIEGDIKE